ncbi:MAG TPA: hypothetical protein VE035_16625 [Puia sp.]|nr:hypothetical protein [Puia sp.]
MSPSQKLATGFMLLAPLLLSFHLCRAQIDPNDLKGIRQCKKALLFQINPMPVEKGRQDSTHRYILDYEVVRSSPMPDSLQRKLLHALGNKNNYIDSNMRSCEFIPAYALRLGRKFETLISTGNCPKIQVYNRKRKRRSGADLILGSTIEQALISAAGK